MTSTINYISSFDSVVRVTYNKATTAYSFKCKGIALTAGDKVVVEDANGLSIVTVREQIRKPVNALVLMDSHLVSVFNKATAWVVCKVDMKDQNARKHASERLTYIKKELEGRRAALEETAIYTLLAQSDPVAAELLQEMKLLL